MTTFYNLVDDISKPMWAYESSTVWCWDGTQITYVNWTRPVSTLWPWTFVGHINQNESGGVGQWSHYDYTHGHFRQCFGGTSAASTTCTRHTRSTNTVTVFRVKIWVSNEQLLS